MGEMPCKRIITLLSCSSITLPPRFLTIHHKSSIPFSFHSYLTSLTHFIHTSAPNSNPETLENPVLSNYLAEYFDFPISKALSVSKRFPRITNLQTPQSVVQFLRNLGFSHTQVRYTVIFHPKVLFSDIDNTLKPKLQFFQDLGLSGSDLGKFFSNNSSLLARTLDKWIVPRIKFLKKILVNDHNNQELIRALVRSKWIFTAPEARLNSNLSYLVDCGIVGSQLSMLLMKQPWIFVMAGSDLRDLVSKVLDMGFSVNSRMLVHALFTVNCMKNDKLTRKFELFKSFGFSEAEYMEMFRRLPSVFRTSEETLKFKLEFFMNTIKIDKTSISRYPINLMLNMEERVIPRYRVLQIIKSKKLVETQPRFFHLLCLREDKFLEKFISRFTANTEELLVAYKGHNLEPVEEEFECNS